MVEGVVNSKSMQRMLSLQERGLCVSEAGLLSWLWPLITCSRISA